MTVRGGMKETFQAEKLQATLRSKNAIRSQGTFELR